MKKVALVGNPNSGKTSLFNVLTGLNQRVGNFAGVTVERKSARLSLNGGEPVEVIDLPGTWTLYPDSRDEQVACEVLREPQHPDHPDAVLVVVDATQLRRGLVLATQVIDLGLPTVLAVNMADLLKREGLRIDFGRLQRDLGVPVVEVSARKGTGVRQLRRELTADLTPPPRRFLNIPAPFSSALAELQTALGTDEPYPAYQALLVPDEFSSDIAKKGQYWNEKLHLADSDALITNELLVRRDRINNILERVLLAPPTPRERLSEKIDTWITHPVLGYVIFVGILLLIFQALFAWAEWPMDVIDAGMGALADAVHTAIPSNNWFVQLLTEGVIPGVGAVVIFLPQIAFLFLFIALLEESGYMARVVFLMDRVVRPFGLSGRSIIPLIGGMACAIPSIMMTRTISDRYERLITILVTPLMSCAARLPVYVLLIALFIPREDGFFNLAGLVLMGLYVLGFFTALLSAFVFKKIFRYRSDGLFVTELPAYRIPRFGNVGRTVYEKSKDFVWEAGRIILVISIVLWFLASYGPPAQMEEVRKTYAPQIEVADASQAQRLETQRDAMLLEVSWAGQLGHLIEPVIRPLGFDWKIGISLVTSFAAREVFVGTMGTLYGVKNAEADDRALLTRLERERDPVTGRKLYDLPVVLSLLVFYAFAMQCMSTLAVTKRETGSWKWAGVMLGYMTALAYLASLVVYQVLA